MPENISYVVDRFWKYDRNLDTSIHILILFVDRITYVHSLKEEAIPFYCHSVHADFQQLCSLCMGISPNIYKGLSLIYNISNNPMWPEEEHLLQMENILFEGKSKYQDLMIINC